MKSEDLEAINESLWEEIEAITKASGYEEYCKGRKGARFTLMGWIKHLKFNYDIHKPNTVSLYPKSCSECRRCDGWREALRAEGKHDAILAE